MIENKTGYMTFEEYIRDDYYRGCGVPKDIAIEGESDFFDSLDADDWLRYGDLYARYVLKKMTK